MVVLLSVVFKNLRKCLNLFFEGEKALNMLNGTTKSLIIILDALNF